MRSVEDMAHEYAVEILKTVHANHGYLSEFELENIAETAFGLAQAMQTELSKLNRGVPEAILEAERRKENAVLLGKVGELKRGAND
ncbi:hypothetical protein E3H47_04725 [Acinetobacter radioresistens]|nr:hypothetical protein E3H47_04725 [Acinetobacter radioresistens]